MSAVAIKALLLLLLAVTLPAAAQHNHSHAAGEADHDHSAHGEHGGTAVAANTTCGSDPCGACVCVACVWRVCGVCGVWLCPPKVAAALSAACGVSRCCRARARVCRQQLATAHH
jgi:hypothetical protein